MAKLSDLFGRRDEADPGLRSNTNGNGGQHITVESVSSVGARMGEENEALRNLLSDAGRKIGELDDLKSAFDKLVTPFNATLRALEQEKSQTLSLSNMLEEARAAYETLRGDFYEVEKKAITLETEVERLREDVELSRESSRSLESTRNELATELSTRTTQLTEIERQLTQETSQRRSLSESRLTLQDQLDAAEKRIVELEGELASTSEKLALLEDEKRSLQLAVDQAMNETARLTRRLTESENTLTATRAQLGKVEASFAETYGERGRLSAALDDTREQHLAERNSLNMRVDALQSRAATAERLLAEARQNLIARTEEVRAFDRKSVEATIARNNSEKRLAQIESNHEARERQIKELEATRTVLGERNATLTKTLKTRETALARADEKIASLSERNAHLEADVQVSRTNIEKRVEELNAALQRERMDRAVVEGALEAARKDNTRLQHEVTGLRSSLRRGLPISDMPAADAENADTPARPRRGKEPASAVANNKA
jgi:crescentin